MLKRLHVHVYAWLHSHHFDFMPGCSNNDWLLDATLGSLEHCNGRLLPVWSTGRLLPVWSTGRAPGNNDDDDEHDGSGGGDGGARDCDGGARGCDRLAMGSADSVGPGVRPSGIKHKTVVGTGTHVATTTAHYLVFFHQLQRLHS